MDVDVAEVAPGVWQARAKHVAWVLVVDGDEVTLVDTGYPGDRERVIASLARLGRSPADVAAVVLTHAHPDHLGSAEHFRAVERRPVLVHEDEVPNATGERIELVSRATLLTNIWRPDVAVWVRDVLSLRATRLDRLGAADTFTTDVLDVPGAPVPIPTPGHTSGHCAFHLPDRGALLVGDALMTEHALARSAGPQLLPSIFNHDDERARESVRALSTVDADVVVPGHGPAYVGTPTDAVTEALASGLHGTGLGASRQPVVIEYEAVVPLPLDEAFAFVSDPLTWPSYFPAMRESSRSQDWEGVGGRARMTNRLLGRTFISDLEMTVWDPPHEFRYLSRQSGAPPLDNRRLFEEVPAGTRLHGATVITPRPGPLGLLDLVQEQALRRTYAAAMTRLPEAARASRTTPTD